MPASAVAAASDVVRHRKAPQWAISGPEATVAERSMLFYAWLVVLLATAIALRLVVYRFAPHLIKPDEIYQVLEPAHRLLFGTGITPWEFIVGIRSWLFPGITAGLMAFGNLFGDDPATIVLPAAVFMALCSMAPVVCSYLWGYRFGGLPGAIAAGALNAVWVDLVYFSTHTLTEVLAGDCLIVALYLAYPGFLVLSRRRLFWAGVFFGLTFAFRFHLTPAIAVAVFWVCRLDVRGRWLPLVTGALAPVLLVGMLDTLTWSYPFQSIWLNFWLNVVEKVSESFGTSPWYMMAVYQVTFWGGAIGLMSAAVLWGGVRLPLLLFVAAAVFATHTAIAHKEYRFIYPALPLLTTLAGVATAEAIGALRRWSSWQPVGPHTAAFLAVALWSTTSLALAVSPSYRALFGRWGGALKASRLVSDEAGVCGVGLLEVPWSQTGGQTYLPPDVPMYATSAGDFPSQSAAFNVLLTKEATLVPDSRYAQRACFANGRDDGLDRLPGVCVWRRAGGCVPGVAPPPPVNWPKTFGGNRRMND
jgi:phosphatidylinositol glycan class B